MNKVVLLNAIRQENKNASASYCEEYADRILTQTDSRLLKNVEEWLAGKELSDIRIGKYSIKLIMDIREDNAFFSALDIMTSCIRNPALADDYVWRFRL